MTIRLEPSWQLSSSVLSTAPSSSGLAYASLNNVDVATHVNVVDAYADREIVTIVTSHAEVVVGAAVNALVMLAVGAVIV